MENSHRLERKAARKAKKQQWLAEYPKYYTTVENVSQSGKVYYNLYHPTDYKRPFSVTGAFMFHRVAELLNLTVGRVVETPEVVV